MASHMKQVNIIVNSVLEEKIIRLSLRVGSSGYTVFSSRSSDGTTGFQTGGSDGNILFMMLIQNDALDKLVEEVAKIKASGYSLKVFVSDVFALD